MAEIYFDNNATTPVSSVALAEVIKVLSDGPGNPSSNHGSGKRARAVLAQAREAAASLVGASPTDLLFGRAATELNHLVLRSLVDGPLRGRKLVTSSVEHSSIQNVIPWLRDRGVKVQVVPVDTDGRISIPAVLTAIAEEPTLLSVQWANNETGVIQPMEELSAAVSDADTVLHVDAVQAVGKVQVDLSDLAIDFCVFSSHKLNGPVGAAALVAPNADRLLDPIPGGQQEAGLIPGTENVAAIAGFGAACADRAEKLDEYRSHTAALRDAFETGLKEGGIVSRVNGSGAPRIPNTSSIQFEGVDAEPLFLRLQASGIACSQGSACTSQRPEPSHVLRAMGLSDAEAWRSLRFSLGAENTLEEAEQVVAQIKRIHGQLSAFQTLSQVG
jgi:cysteine desulfurase